MKQLLMILIIAFCSVLIAETYYFQGFEESSQDNWSYTANPNPDRLIYWGRVNTTLGSASPYQGEWYWASWDLDNIPSSLTFDNVWLPLGHTYQLSFYYFTSGLESATEYSRYCISIDGGFSWDGWIDLLPNTNTWTLATVELPAYAPQIMLKVEAKHDGIAKFAHWDHFNLSREPVEPSQPLVYNVSAVQRFDGSGTVDIHYGLFDANADECDISMLVANGPDATFDYSPLLLNLSGDIGNGISNGDDKHIVWLAGDEDISFDGNQYRIRVIADDGTNPQVATPVFDPPGGFYSSPQTISISCNTTSSQIYYTTDGSEPDMSSELYAGPIFISSTTMFKAKAYRTFWQVSETAVAVYERQIPDNFVYVAGGTFNVATSDESYASISVSSFYLDKYEVTQSHYQQIMGVNPSHFSGYANRPVEWVTWFNAIEYCNRRSIIEELTPCYSYESYGTNPNNWPQGWNANNDNHLNIESDWSADGYRLPTEMEWMFAAKGGNQSQGYTYSGSNDINAVAWYASNSNNETHDVGGKAPNELGTYDMSGNVFEWCWDIYDEYLNENQSNPTGAISGSTRLLRGGCWYNADYYCDISTRVGAYAPNSTYMNMGFRILRPIPWVASPVFSHPGGSYSIPMHVSISCDTDGSTIRYTTDGSEPHDGSIIYSDPIYVSSDTTIKTKAFKSGIGPSATICAEYTGFGFVFIQGGTIYPASGIYTDGLTVSDFYIDKYELTNAEWEAVMGSGGGDDYPHAYVSWFGAIEYCNRRSMMEDLPPCYSYLDYGTNPDDWPSGWNTSDANHVNVSCDWNAIGYRLPTEAEWEYAARGGLQTHGYTYSGSNDLNLVGWHNGNSGYSSHPVGQLAANELGTYDMSGNLWEMVWDPVHPLSSAHTERGGAYISNEEGCTVSARGNSFANAFFGYLSFRICRTAP